MNIYLFLFCSYKSAVFQEIELFITFVFVFFYTSFFLQIFFHCVKNF